MNRHGILILVVMMVAHLGVTIRAQNITIPSDSIRGPMCVVVDSTTRVAAPLSPQQSEYNVIVTDGLAQITLTQLFVNDYGHINDIVYVFPLPHEAAIHAMSVQYHGKLYKAEIVEKQEAKVKYDSVVQSGGTAALLLQDRPNVFQQRLANIAFQDTAWVQIKLTLPLKYDNGSYELAIPTMVAERFQSVNASSVMSSGRLWNPPADRNGQTLQINILIQTGFPIYDLSSPTHPLAISESDDARELLESHKVINKNARLHLPYNSVVVLSQATTYPNKDFVLRFSRTAAQVDFTVASYYDTILDVGYFYGNIFPDTSIFVGERPQLDIVLLIDISGSQAGWPLAKEKEIAHTILDKLTVSDRLSVLSFSDNVSWCFGSDASVSASEENIATARTFINNLSTMGGTNLLAGVQTALSIPSDEAYSRFFIFCTDGFITNESAILSAIRDHDSSPTIFTFGAGNNLNRYFLDESAKIGNGISTEITQNEDVAPLVNIAWNKIGAPQLKDIDITCGELDRAQLLLPNGAILYKGSPVTILGIYKNGGQRTVTITGTRMGETVTLKKEIELADAPNVNCMLPQVWAKQMISKLRIDEGTGTANKNHIIELSEQYQVLSDYTAFLAINPVEVTEENQISTAAGVTLPNTPMVGDILSKVTVKMVMYQLLIEAPQEVALQEIALYDLAGRCLFMTKLFGSQNCSRFSWDGILCNGIRIARGQYILKIRTTHGLVSRSVIFR